MSANRSYVSRFGLWNGQRRLKLLERDSAQALMAELLASRRPAMVGRYGSVEYSVITRRRDFAALCNNAGFFPTDERLMGRFIDVYDDASRQLDVLAIWNYNRDLSALPLLRKARLVRRYANIEHLIDLETLNPHHYYNQRGWIPAITGRRILIVHPFAATIHRQIEHGNTMLADDNDVSLLKAVQTIGDEIDERFSDWFAALDHMKAEIGRCDFDLCLIGCGAYGFPLAAHVKRLGRQAILLGGALQLLFKIKGRRWENQYRLKFDDSWIYPLAEDVPAGAEKVEGGCYWGAGQAVSSADNSPGHR